METKKKNVTTTQEKVGKNEQRKRGKKVNKTWEAFGKWKGAFTIIDPKFLL